MRPPLLPGSVRYRYVEEAGFVARLLARPPIRLDPAEHSDYRWLAAGELAGVRMAEPKRTLALRALEWERPALRPPAR